MINTYNLIREGINIISKRFRGLAIFVVIFVALSLMVGCVETKPVSSDIVSNISIESINVTNAMEIIEELSSEKYMGRLAGTHGNELAVKYIENYFKEIGLESPEGLDEFRQTYPQKVLINEAAPIIRIEDKNGNIDKEFDFLLDYRIMAIWQDVKVQGSTTAEMVVINSALDINNSNEDLDGKILLIDNSIVAGNPNGAYNILQMVLKLNQQIEGIIINLDNRNSEYYIVSTSLFGVDRGNKVDAFNNKTGPIMAYCTDEAFAELSQAASEGKKLHMEVNYNYRDDISHNVIGVIPGSEDESKEYIIISAHLDHVGDNKDGTYNPGAFDNASGTAALMEIARVLTSTEATPKKTIVFLAFNGEEQYLYGSNYYVNNPLYPLKDTVLINMDMVGSKEIIPLKISGELDLLKNKLYDLALELGLDVVKDADVASDQRPFNQAGVEAVTLIHHDVSKIHTPKDTIEYIDSNRLEEVIGFVLNYIDRYGY
ncbi:M28 family metallopeptidase [Alkaliphilus peptidifermentans]|uniref:Peptidase family M28 n=1 Tax=Alkaliphilus peptidifermentans DSM 18978 TaxID=1120976 RepID=A0A1G5F2C0_9FIRM|nr:M28 family metallopeptidase [Alkaliphilus peptidifermentans]SCY33406.1 Peptidase family M28 [Alkaliphilus peptidifermentans DSM 18978]